MSAVVQAGVQPKGTDTGQQVVGVADLFERVRARQGPLGQYYQQLHGYYAFPQLEGPIGNRMYFRGKEVIVWSINNYLGLANHPEVRAADAEAARQWGLAYPMGSRMLTGETRYHLELETQLAQFVRRPAAFLMNYGYQGMFSVLAALVDRRDVIIYDNESHACIVDGVHLHKGRRFTYPHNDIDALERVLARAVQVAKRTGGGILVVTEGVFGMNGHQGALKEIVALKEKYPFRLIVDDAHGFGVMGPTGAGTDEAQGVQEGVDLYFGTFAKAMASIGAFVAGDEAIIRYLKYNVRSQIFAKSLPLPIVLGNLKRLELIRKHPELRERLWRITRLLQEGLRQRGFDIGNTTTPVTPVYLKGTKAEAASLVADLRENYHIFCSGVIYPVIPKGKIILRLIPTAVHTEEDVQQTLDAFEAVREKLVSGYYRRHPVVRFPDE